VVLLLHGVLHLTHRATGAPRAALHPTGTLHTAGALHRVLHLTHRAARSTGALHGVLAHRSTGSTRAGAVLLGARTSRQLRGTAGQLGRSAHVLLLRRHLLLHRLRSGYGRRHRTVLLVLAHARLLVLRGGTSGRGQLGPQVLVLAEQSGQLRFHLVEEGVDLVLVIALSKADGRELLVPNVLGGQRHLFTST
jgi:hypothetical protein